MALTFPETENSYSGGSDVWDNDLAGEILLQDYFEQASFSQTLVLPVITDSDTLYAPTVALVQELVLPHITDGDTLYAPTIANGAITLSLPFISTNNVLNTPIVELPALEISLPTIVGDVLYPPTVTTETGVTLPFISSVSNLYQLKLNPAVTIPFIPSTASLYAPTVDPSFTTLVLPFLINEEIMNRFLLTRQEKRWTGLTWIE